MANELDIVIRWLLDQASQQKVVQGSNEVAKSLDGVKSSFPGDELSRDFAIFQQAFDKTFKRVDDDLIDTRTGLKATENTLRQFSKTTTDELNNIRNADQQATQSNDQLAKSAAAAAAAQARVFSIEGRLLSNQVTQIRAYSQEWQRIATGLSQVSRIGLVAGTAITGGIFGFAAKYVKDAKEANEITIAWKKSQDSLNESQQRIGAVFAEAVLPLLQRAAEIADKTAAFVEKNPQLVQAALNIGLITVGLSTIGLAVSKGIKLYADALYLQSVPIQLQAAQLQAAAAEQQLVAAQLRAESRGIETATGLGTGAGAAGNVLGKVGTVLLYATSLVLGAEVGNNLGNAIAKAFDKNAPQYTLNETLFFGGVRAIEAMEQKSQNVTKNILETLSLTQAGDKVLDTIFGKLGLGLQKQDQFFQKLLLGLDSATNKAEQLNNATSGGPLDVQNSPQFDKILSAYEKYKNDDLALVQKHYADRQKIISDAFQQEQKADEKYASDVANVNQNMAKSLGDARKSYEQADLRAQQQYEEQRANIIKSGNEDIARIQQQAQEKLRQLNIQHADRVDELTRSRDALGLVKEKRDYDRQKAELNRGTNEEIRQRRREIAQRLADLQASYEQERAQRLADYQARVAEIQASAKEQLDQLKQQHAEELRQIRQQRIDRIRELDQQYSDERKRRYDQFIQDIRDLDASLLGESKLKQQYYDKMIVDLNAFLEKYRSGLASLSNDVPARAGGGYASFGVYRLGDTPSGSRGQREYVLSGNTTAALERVLGGRITQDQIVAMAAMMGAGGGGSNMNYTDNRRLDSRIGPIERQQLIDDSVAAMRKAWKGVVRGG